MSTIPPGNQWNTSIAHLDDNYPIRERHRHYLKECQRLERFAKMAEAGKAEEVEIQSILELLTQVAQTLQNIEAQIK